MLQANAGPPPRGIVILVAAAFIITGIFGIIRQRTLGGHGQRLPQREVLVASAPICKNSDCCPQQPIKSGSDTKCGRRKRGLSPDHRNNLGQIVHDFTNEATKSKAQRVTHWYYGIRTFSARVTAYNSVPEQTDKRTCESADGADICALKSAGIESCAGAFPFQSLVRIPGWKTCQVHDRTADQREDHIDIYLGGVDQLSASRAWGVRYINVTLILPPYVNQPH